VAKPEKEETSRDWLHSLPAFIGLTLGCVYALGAISVFGQLYAADVSPSQMLWLVPLEQMLARGIASLIPVASYLALLFVFLYGLRYLMIRMEAQRKERRPKEVTLDSDKPPSSNRLIKGLKRFEAFPEQKPLVWALIIFLIIASMAPPLLMLALLLALLGGVVIVTTLGLHYNWSSSADSDKTFVVWMISVTLCGAIAASFLQANPLPDVSLTLRSGECINGGLVLDAGDTWYVKTHSDHVAAIPSRNVLVSHVRLLDRPIEESALNFLTGRKPMELGELVVRGGRKDVSSPCD